MLIRSNLGRSGHVQIHLFSQLNVQLLKLVTPFPYFHLLCQMELLSTSGLCSLPSCGTCCSPSAVCLYSLVFLLTPFNRCATISPLYFPSLCGCSTLRFPILLSSSRCFCSSHGTLREIKRSLQLMFCSDSGKDSISQDLWPDAQHSWVFGNDWCVYKAVDVPCGCGHVDKPTPYLPSDT